MEGCVGVDGEVVSNQELLSASTRFSVQLDGLFLLL